jgi:hypothetical protein
MAKKASADEKVGRKKTGGGTCEVVVDEMTQKVLAVLGNRATPLFNPFDADADYNGNFGMFMVMMTSFLYAIDYGIIGQSL